jgi:nucleotide-binding universal stress UspA family protein
LKRLFVGSTAERVLDRMHCDILVVKPPRGDVAT